VLTEGAAAVRSVNEEWFANYEEYENQLFEVRDLGNGVVFVVNQLDARPAGSTGRVRERLTFTLGWGIDGLSEAWLDWLSPRETYRTEMEEARDLGERVLLLVRDFGRREGSTQEVASCGGREHGSARGRGVPYSPLRLALAGVSA
jgi:hypothetical protein